MATGLVYKGRVAFALSGGIAGKAYSELFENFAVHFAEHFGGVHLTSAKLREDFEGPAAVFVIAREDGEGYEDFVGVQARVVAVQVFGLGVLYRLYEGLWDELEVVVDAGEVLDGVEEERGTGAEELAALARYDAAILKFDSRAWVAALFRALLGGDCSAAVSGVESGLFEEKGYLVDFGFIVCAGGEVVKGGVVASDDLVA